jgi:hypothetical protein
MADVVRDPIHLPSRIHEEDKTAPFSEADVSPDAAWKRIWLNSSLSGDVDIVMKEYRRACRAGELGWKCK